VSTCRAGNFIGGGDFAANRIIPYFVRAVEKGETIIVRNPYSVRPYQHVLEPVMAYFMVAMKQYEDYNFAGCYNIGPDEADCISTGELVSLFCDKWGDGVRWEDCHDGGPHEAGFLKLDCAKVKNIFGWKPVWHVETAMEKIVEWYVGYLKKDNLTDITTQQVEEYLSRYGQFN
ncbi:MAG: CDP-glucose 4,6-dehydratase, partial [Pseudobutyrivibrio sp.]|nr:CDP-glucose 4,6-dehydratase [Pseudobutyrivibrio sp.]